MTVAGSRRALNAAHTRLRQGDSALRRSAAMLAFNARLA
jgi:hypothetical protein